MLGFLFRSRLSPIRCPAGRNELYEPTITKSIKNVLHCNPDCADPTPPTPVTAGARCYSRCDAVGVSMQRCVQRH